MLNLADGTETVRASTFFPTGEGRRRKGCKLLWKTKPSRLLTGKHHILHAVPAACNAREENLMVAAVCPRDNGGL